MFLCRCRHNRGINPVLWLITSMSRATSPISSSLVPLHHRLFNKSSKLRVRLLPVIPTLCLSCSKFIVCTHTLHYAHGYTYLTNYTKIHYSDITEQLWRLHLNCLCAKYFMYKAVTIYKEKGATSIMSSLVPRPRFPASILFTAIIVYVCWSGDETSSEST